MTTGESVAMAQMPKYKCHKEVWALKIASFARYNDGVVTINPSNPRFKPITLDAEVAQRFNAMSDVDAGYYVQYEGDYVSWSPTKVFDDGYTLIE